MAKSCCYCCCCQQRNSYLQFLEDLIWCILQSSLFSVTFFGGRDPWWLCGTFGLRHHTQCRRLGSWRPVVCGSWFLHSFVPPPRPCQRDGSFSGGAQTGPGPQQRAGPGDLTPLSGWVGRWAGPGFVTRPGKCRRVSDASAADVWRSIRDNGSGWTRRSRAKIFPGLDCVYLINTPSLFSFEGSTAQCHTVSLCRLLRFAQRVTSWGDWVSTPTRLGAPPSPLRQRGQSPMASAHSPPTTQTPLASLPPCVCIVF